MIHTKVSIPVLDLITPNPDMGIRWKDGLINNAETINARRKERVSDSGKFGEIIATPSAEKFEPFVSGSFVSDGDLSAADIKTKHRSNILNAYNKYNDNLDKAFEEVDGVFAKRFKDNVEAKQSAWEEGVTKVLRLVGSRARGRQVAAIMGEWLTGNMIISGQLPGGSEVLPGGGPYDIAKARLKATLRAGLAQLLIQTGVMVMASGYDSAQLADHNQRIMDFLASVADPVKANNWVATRTVDKSYCVWYVDNGQLKLEAQMYTA
ncbi:MAG TPA: hypothetical protein VJC37_06605 [Planctomycetota bacterium]|nr:hypothetical protein [Planctomycetota bacterium]